MPDHPPQPPEPVSRLALAIVVLAGFTDAFSYLQFRKVYVSFMSGNTTALSVAMAQSDWSQTGLLAAVVAVFVGGVVFGTVLHRRGQRPAATVLAVVAAILAGSAVAATQRQLGPGPLLLLALGMGVLNAAVHQASRSQLALTYVTGALVKIGTGLADRLSGQPWPDGWGRQVLDWLALAVGAVAGALAWHWLKAPALLLAAAAAILLAVAARRVPAA